MESLVVIRNLNHYFRNGSLDKQILFDINLEIYPGELIILTGPSGSGKTTLLSLMGGLRSVQEGSIRTLGKELHGARENQLVRVRRQIGYIFQDHNLLPFMTALQNVQMSVELHEDISNRQAHTKSEAILQAVGLSDRLNYYPQNLSGGQKQRVAIARALVSHPKLVLADEPTAALDSKTGRAVVELMQRLAKEQECAILIVTHDNRILDRADRIIHMEDGRLVKNRLIDWASVGVPPVKTLFD
jgi:putative ABC transport system ATP-binding protein